MNTAYYLGQLSLMNLKSSFSTKHLYFIQVNDVFPLNYNYLTE